MPLGSGLRVHGWHTLPPVRDDVAGLSEAYVTYCSDESRSYIKNRKANKANKANKTPTTEDAYVLYPIQRDTEARGECVAATSTASRPSWNGP